MTAAQDKDAADDRRAGGRARSGSGSLVTTSISQQNRSETTQGASSNTPPLNTETPIKKQEIPEENQIVIDWFEFTLPDDFTIKDRYHVLKYLICMEGASFRPAPRGLLGYKTQILYGKAKVLMNGSDGMGVHVILSGDALRQMKGNIFKLLEYVLFHNGKVTRIDLALDDVSGELTINRVKRAVYAGAVSCRAKESRIMQKCRLSDGQIMGETVYFGSSQSRTQYRIYDKAAEQGLDQVHWVRCEGQYRQENAHQVAQKIAAAGYEIGDIYCGLLRGYLNFLTPSKKDTNKGRWKTASWWLDLLKGAEKLHLSLPKAAPALETKLNWFKKQVAPSFACLLDAYGPEPMKEIYLLGRARMSSELRDLCAVPF